MENVRTSSPDVKKENPIRDAFGAKVDISFSIRPKQIPHVITHLQSLQIYQ